MVHLLADEDGKSYYRSQLYEWEQSIRISACLSFAIFALIQLARICSMNRLRIHKCTYWPMVVSILILSFSALSYIFQMTLEQNNEF